MSLNDTAPLTGQAPPPEDGGVVVVVVAAVVVVVEPPSPDVVVVPDDGAVDRDHEFLLERYLRRNDDAVNEAEAAMKKEYRPEQGRYYKKSICTGNRGGHLIPISGAREGIRAGDEGPPPA